MKNNYHLAATMLKEAKRISAFTGAGISVESGIPPFRGENGLWNKYDPGILVINNFYQKPLDSWIVIKKIFYDFFSKAKPNAAHRILALMEQKRKLLGVVTQNIDNLHQLAGNKEVYEFHGNSQRLVCLNCESTFPVDESVFKTLPPKCQKCSGLLKPDFIFFGEAIPHDAYEKSIKLARNTDLMLVIGTTGEVMPAATIPQIAKQNGSKIIEINTQETSFTNSITDLLLRGKATEVMAELEKLLLLDS